jgi:DNA-binding transcriptional LysR family regulator
MIAAVIDLNEMALFARVAREGSFVKAARALGVPTSTVSRKVARLEARLGVRLLQRTSRRVAMTEEGAAYHERCARIVAEAEEADRALAAGREAIRGTLRIAAPRLFGDVFLGPILASYLARHPGVKVQVVLADPRADLVAEGFDLAIRVGKLADAAHLVARRIGSSETRFCASPDYLRRHGVPETPEALSRHACITVGESRSGVPWRFGGEGGPRTLRVHGRLVVNSFAVALQTAIAGQGIAVLAAFTCAESVQSGALSVILDGFVPPPTPLYAIYPRAPEVPARVRAFLDLLQPAAAPWLSRLRTGAP